MSWSTPPFGFPTVTHIHRSTRHDQIVTMTKEHIATRQYQPAIFYGREIDEACRF
jgi:hypothetical protein